MQTANLAAALFPIPGYQILNLSDTLSRSSQRGNLQKVRFLVPFTSESF
jgi:hypothetical protein